MGKWLRVFVILILLVGSIAIAAELPATIERVGTSEKVIAMTFDAHAQSAGEPQYGVAEILNTLAANHIHCTFFLTGMYMEYQPEVVREIIAQGHEIGNHSYSHQYVEFPNESKQRLVNELTKTRAILHDKFGATMAGYWRAPYGHYNPAMLEWAREAGFQHIGWTVDSWDWITDKNYKLYLTADGLLKRFQSFIDKGAEGYIFLDHLRTERVSDDFASVLQKAIDYAQSKGYRFVTVSELIKSGQK